MAVRAKMRVTGLAHSCNPVADDESQCKTVTVTLQPVFGGKDDEANRSWSKWTPSGEVRMTITNPEASKQFEIGKAYFVDFSPGGELMARAAIIALARPGRCVPRASAPRASG